MRIKYRPEDFVVQERARTVEPDGDGEFAVYRLTKRKLTTFEAVGRLARVFRIPKRDIRFAGLKDRQSVSEQVISIRGPHREYADDELALEYLGRTEEPLTSEANEANHFEIVVRDCREADLKPLEKNLDEVKRYGLPNYFDDQRFSCVRYGQGFIARDFIAGDFESAFKKLVATVYDNDDATLRHLKGLIRRMWGRWNELLESLGERQMFRSAVEHLAHEPKDFAGALNRLGTGLKTIHLFAYQSYIWNWTVHRYLRKCLEKSQLSELPFAIAFYAVWHELHGVEKQRWLEQGMSVPLIDHTTRIDDGRLAKALSEALKHEQLSLSRFRIPSEEIFFREEPRSLVLLPQGLKVDGPERDEAHRGRQKVRLRFTLPRGSYGTLVVRRLFLGSPNLKSLTAPRSAPRDKETRHGDEKRSDTRGKRAGGPAPAGRGGPSATRGSSPAQRAPHGSKGPAKPRSKGGTRSSKSGGPAPGGRRNPAGRPQPKKSDNKPGKPPKDHG